uniref:Uncharacterized protein n=1 Tax=Oryza brachyantha TaxID=4533 RepID=J3L7Q5_ORYBR
MDTGHNLSTKTEKNIRPSASEQQILNAVPWQFHGEYYWFCLQLQAYYSNRSSDLNSEVLTWATLLQSQAKESPGNCRLVRKLRGKVRSVFSEAAIGQSLIRVGVSRSHGMRGRLSASKRTGASEYQHLVHMLLNPGPDNHLSLSLFCMIFQ